jgi:hypothetical protein
LYQPDETIRLEVRIENEAVWLNRQQIAQLFDRDVKTIGKHINNALREELSDFSTVAKFATIQMEGNREVLRNIEYYSLDMILSVGYRVKSQRGIQYRQWANRVLKEYLLRGISINQRIEQLESKMIEFDLLLKTSLRNERLLQDEIRYLRNYIESILADFNDINEDTRIQLELINEMLAELQVQNKILNKPHKPIGFKMSKD